MHKRTKIQTITFIMFYVFAIIIAGLGVNLILRAELGAGAWDAVNANFSKLINITVGTASAIINVLLLLLVVSYRKSLKYLIILVPIISIAISIDFWDLLILGEWQLEITILRVLSLTLGILLISLALALIIITKYPAMIYDEITLMLMILLKTKSFLKARIVLEVSAILIAIFFGVLAGISYGAVSYGSVVLAIIIGPLIQMQIKWLEAVLKKLKLSYVN